MKESNSTRNIKNVTFSPKDVQRIPSSRKISEKYNEQRKCSRRNLFIKTSQYSQENTCAEISFLIKAQAFSAADLLKGDSNTGVLLRILRNF